MICPECKKTIKLGPQLADWDYLNGENAMASDDFPILINLKCSDCKDYTAMVAVHPGKFESNSFTHIDEDTCQH